MLKKQNTMTCAGLRLGSAWASAQSDQNLCGLHEENTSSKLSIGYVACLWSDRLMSKLIRVFYGPTCHFVDNLFVLQWLNDAASMFSLSYCYLTLCPLLFFLSTADFFHNQLFRKNRHSVGPDLVPNCLQKLSTDDTGRQLFFNNLTFKAPPITCSRRQLQILPLFQK